MRFRIQYSLRAALLMVSILAIGLAWHARRASWFRARARLKADLETAGYRFYTAEEVNAKHPSLFADFTVEKSWGEQWDSFWFGQDAAKTFVFCGVGIHRFCRTESPDPHILSKAFPDIEMLVILMHFDDLNDEFWINGATIPRLTSTRLEQWQDMQREFAELPKLRIVYINMWGINHSFVDALPEHSLLEEIVNTSIHLTPEHARMLLEKSPRLKSFHLNETALDESVQEALNNSYAEENIDHPIHAAERPNEPHVNLYTTDE